MHLCATKTFVVALLTGSHLHQRRPAEEDLRPPLDHHDVVAHPRHICAARSRVTEDDGHLRVAKRGCSGDVAKSAATGDEDLALRWKVGATRLGEADYRQPILARNLGGTLTLAQRVRIGRTTALCRIVPADDALDAFDDADAADVAAANRKFRAIGGEWRQLEKRRVRIE